MEKILEQLNYFTNEDMRKFVGTQNADIYLSRYTKNGDIIRLKRGIYITKKRLDLLEKNQKFDAYVYYIATNILITPSYLSGEYILAKNNIIIENVYAITAITTKKTNMITNVFGRFIYKNIDEKLFWWYETKKNGDFIYFQAYPEKALLDRIRLKKDLVLQLNYFKELRLELDHINFDRLQEFAKKFNKQKINQAFILLKKLKW